MYNNSCFCFWKLLIFICGFSAKVIGAFLAYKKLCKLNTFWDQKKTLSSTFLFRLRFQRYYCESGIAIFARTVAWNNALSPFSEYSLHGKYFINLHVFIVLLTITLKCTRQCFRSMDWIFKNIFCFLVP